MAYTGVISKSEKVNLTAGRISAFECPKDKPQAFLWSDDPLGLAVRAYPSGVKAFIYQTKINKKSVRLTIGDVNVWGIAEAQKESRRLQTQIDDGNDPRQIKADKEAAKITAKLSKEAEAALLVTQQARESVTAGEAWQHYVTERSASIKDGKPEWGENIKKMHHYYVAVGGVKRKSGRRAGEPETTRQGILLPFMSMRLVDLDAKAVKAWLDIEVHRAPINAAQAFRYLHAFINWCSRNEKYKSIVHSDACQSVEIKKLIPSAKTKPNDSLRKAQIKPWFDEIKKVRNPIIAAYLQGLLLTGARRNELTTLRWENVDFKWKSLTIRDKVEGERTIPLTPYLESLITPLPRRNEFVFSSPASASGRLEEPRKQHNAALAAAALPALSLHGLRRSFGTLSEWVEVPAGIVAQIMGHKPSAIAEKHYIQRELDLLHLWHVKIEDWILEQAEIKYEPTPSALRVVKK